MSGRRQAPTWWHMAQSPFVAPRGEVAVVEEGGVGSAGRGSRGARVGTYGRAWRVFRELPPPGVIGHSSGIVHETRVRIS